MSGKSQLRAWLTRLSPKSYKKECQEHGATARAWLRFNRITQQAIRRRTFGSVKELVAKIDQYVKNSNRRSQSFVWTATADSILAKVERLA